MIKNKVNKGYTLIEVITTIVIASIVTIGMYTIFTESSRDINRESVMHDVKNYVTIAMQEISQNIRKAEEVDYDSSFGNSQSIDVTLSDGETIRYSIINNLICKNGTPLQAHGDHWLKDTQELYDLSIRMNCEKATLSTEADDPNLQDNFYDVIITVDIQSNTDSDYTNQFRSKQRVLAVNQFVLSGGPNDSDS